SGINPVRSKRAHPDLPTAAKYEWTDFVPPSQALLSGGPIDQTTVSRRTNVSKEESCQSHPHVVDQDYITSWNNKQAPGSRAPDDDYSRGSAFPSSMLDDQIRKRIRGKRRLTLPKLVDSMEQAGTVDLRGD